MNEFDTEDIVNPSEFDAADLATPVAPKDYTKTESFIKGAEQGATLGFADEAQGAVSGISDDMMRIANLLSGGKVGPSPTQVDEQLAAQGFKAPSSGTMYDVVRDEARQDYNAAAKANPMSNFAGNLVGGALTLPFMPAKAIAPLGQVSRNAPIMARLGKAAINAAPLSAVTSAGISEANTIPELASDVALGTATGMALGPIVDEAAPLVGKGLTKVKDKSAELLNMFPGEPVNRFKLGMRGIIGVSQSTADKIENILNKQIGKFRNKIDEEELTRLNSQNSKLQNIESSILANDATIKKLSNDYSDILTQQSAYKRDALNTKKTEKSNVIDEASATLKKQIEEAKAQRDALLADYERETFESISKYESDLAEAKAKEELLKNEKIRLKDLDSKQIASKTQDAYNTDLAQVKSNYDMLDADLLNRNVKFNISQDLKEFENTIKGLARNDEELLALNDDITSTLKKYKGTIDRKTLIDLINGFKDKYGKQQGSHLKFLRSKIKDPNTNRLYGSAFDSLEDSVRKTQDFQLREFGHKDLADQYAQNNSAYRALKDLEQYGGEDYAASLVSQIQDLGKFGNVGVNKGAKGILADIEKNQKLLPSFARILPDEISPYIKKSTEDLPNEMMQNSGVIGNLENLLSELKSNKKMPNKFSQNKKDVELLAKITELEDLITNTKKNLDTGAFGDDVQNRVSQLEKEIEVLSNVPDENPTYTKFTDKAKENQKLRDDLLNANQRSNLAKRDILTPTPKTSQVEKLLAKDPIDRDAELRKIIQAADKERTIGGRGSAVEKLESLANELNVDTKDLDPEIKELQDLLSAYQDNVNFAFNKSGGVATGGETIGALSNAAGYIAGLPVRAGKAVAAPVNKALQYVGKQNVVPTTTGLKSLDEVLARISNKPLENVMEMDATGKAALKNTLLQISPEVREYLEKQEKNKGAGR